MIINNKYKVYLFTGYTFLSVKLLFLMAFANYICFSCTKELNININQENKQLVINSVFSPDEDFTFKFSNTTSVLNDYDTIPDSLHFVLYENKTPIIDKIVLSTSLDTKIIPKGNTYYSLEIQSKNYPTLFANDSIPDRVPIDEATLKCPISIGKDGLEVGQANISFTDPPNERNYYEFQIYSYNGPNRHYWQNYGDFEVTDPVLLNEGDAGYHPTSYFFSDELFNGKKYTIQIKNNAGTDEIYTVIFRSISRKYYLYRKYYTRHSYNQQLQGEFPDYIFKGEPQTMYTNVINGYGIFVGYTQTEKELTQIK